MRFNWICVFMPLFFSTTVYATSERSLLSRTEDASKRTTNTRVWRYNYQVTEPDPMGLSPATIRTETAEVIEKGDNLFFEDPQDRTLRETSNNWINLNGAFQSTQRRDQVRILNDLSSRETTIRYSPSANNTFVFKILGHGLYNVAENTFLSRETVRDAALSRTPTRQSDTVLADWENLHLRAELHTGGVHLNFVLQSPEEIPSIDQDQSPRHIHYVVEYELTSPTGELTAYSNKRLLLPGSDSPPSLSTIGFGWKDGNTPECYLRPSFAFSTSSSDSPRSTFREVLVESDRIRIIEGLPYSWLKSRKTLYPVIIDPDFYTRSGHDIQKKGETWESGKTYFISETYSIGEDQHLVIEAGAIVKINGGENLGSTRHIYVIDGTLSVCGEPYNYAILTSADDDSVGVPLDSQMNVVPGLHGGIGVRGGYDGTKYKVNSSKFNYMKITNGYYGLWLQNFFGDSKTSPVFATIRDCVFDNLKEVAINIETDNEKTTPDSNWKPICVVNNLFKNPLNPASRQSDLSIWVRQVIDADAARIDVIAANNTFASENHENGPNSCIKATFEGDFDDLDSNTELTMILNNNIFLWGESQVGLGVQLADGQSGHGADLLIVRNNNAYWGDEPFAKIIGGAENSLNLTVSEDLNAQTLPSDPFDTPSVLGEYYIKESNFYESYFKNKGIGDAGAYGLLGKTVLPPEKKEGALASNEVWARREINGSPIRDYDRVDIGYHYDPVDYTLNYLGTFPTGEVVHTDGNDLTIKPGTVVVAANDVISGRLNIDGGAFKAEGLPGEPIRWLPYTATGDGMRSPDAGDWWGLQITGDPATRTVSLIWNLVEYAWWGTSVQFDEPDPLVPVNVVIEDNVFNWNKIAIKHDGSRDNEKGVTIRNNRVLNSKWSYGISLYNSDALVVNNTLALTKPAYPLQSGININGKSNPTIAYNVILGQNNGIYVGDVQANPDIMDNVVWDCDNFPIADPFDNPNSEAWTDPITGNPCYVSSDERGFRDESEHFFLPQLEGDASRLPWIVSDLDNTDGVAVSGISVSSGGSIEVYAVDSNLTPEVKGYYVPAGYSEQYVSTNDMTDTAAIRFVGPMSFNSTPALTLKTIQGSEMKVAIPTAWKDNGIAADENWVFWIALDGSLYYARKDHSMEDVQVTPPDGWNMTAIYAMQYHEAASDYGDLDTHYPNGLAASAFDSFGADPSISSAYQSVSPDYNVAPYTYHGTKSRFYRIGGQISVPAPAPFSDLDMGYHPFRGRTWVRNDENIQLSWDPPHEHPVVIDHYKATLYKGEVEIDSVQVQEDARIDARALNGNVPLDEIGPDDEDAYEIRLSPVDENENAGAESVVRFGVDRTPPMLSITSSIEPTGLSDMVHIEPETGKTYYHEDVPSNVTSFDLDFSVSDATSGVWKSIHMEDASDENVRDVYRETDSILGIDFTHDLNKTGSSRFRAYDLAGNVREIVFEMDDVPPVPYAIWTSLVDGVLGGEIGAVDEGSGLRKMQLLVDVPTYSSPLVVLEWDSDLGSEYEESIGWSIGYLPPTTRWVEEEVQDYKIYVRAWDNVGNMSESEKFDFQVPNDDPEGEPIYVDGSNITETEDGTSWQTAFNTIQEALGVASNGDRIFVAEGVYEENLLVQKRVKIYGGFAGLGHPRLSPQSNPESDVDGRDVVENNRTIIEPADQISSVITNDVNSHFALFDGLVIRKGKAESSDGGAAKCVSFSPTFVNCVFANNRTNTEGGAVYCDYSFPQFVHCTFASNFAGSNGGAIACRNGSKPDLRNCIVWGNESDGEGDEIFLDGTSEANVNYSCVREGWNGGVGNIDGDPKFVNPAEDWRLRHDTSCANAGDLGLVSEIDRDILGDPRVPGESGGFDLGAYELEKRLTGSTGVTVSASSKRSSGYSEDFLLQGEAFLDYTGDELTGEFSGWVSDFEYWGDPSPSKDYFDMDPTLWFDLGRVHYVSAINVWNFAHTSFIDVGISNVRISYSIDGIDYTVLHPQSESDVEGADDMEGFPRFAIKRFAPEPENSRTTIPLGDKARFIRFDHTSPHKVCLDCSEVDCQACCSVMADCDCVPYDPDPGCENCQIPCDGGNCSDDPACELEVCSTCSPGPCTAPGPCNDDGGCSGGCTAFICEDYGTCPASKRDGKNWQNLGHKRSLGEVQFVGYPLEDYNTISSVAVDFSGTSLPIYATPLPSYPALTETPTPNNINLVRNLMNSSQSSHLRSTELDEMWRSGVDSGNTLTFFLDGHYLIDKIVLWNYNPPNADVGYGVKSLDVDVAVAIDPEFTGTPTFLTIPTAATTPATPTPIPTGFGNIENPAIPLLLPQPYPMKAKFVRFQNMVNHYDVNAGGFSEIQFFGRRIGVPREVTLSSTMVPELTDAILAEEFSSTSSADMWTGSLDDEIEFDFDKTIFLRSVHFWNWNDQNSLSKGARTIALFVDASTTPIMHLSLAEAPGNDSYTGESFDLGGLTATKVRLQIKSNHGGDGVGLSEVAFLGEMEYANKKLTEVTTASFRSNVNRFYVDQFEFEPTPTYDLKDQYVEKFKDMNDRWEWRAPQSLVSPAAGYRSAVWYPIGDSENELFNPSSSVACSSPPEHYYASYGDNADTTERLDSRTPYPTVSSGIPTPIPNPQSTVPAYWYLPATPPATPEYNPRFPFEFRPWGDSPGVLFEAAATATPMAVSDDGHSFWLRMQDGEACAPEAIKSGWNATAGKGDYFDASNMPFLGKVPWSHWLDLRGFVGTEDPGPAKIAYGWHILRADFSNLSGVSQNFSIFEGSGFQTQFEFLAGDRGTSRVGTTVYANDRPITEQGEVVGVSRPPKAARMGGIEGDGTDTTDLTKGYHLYRMFISRQEVRMYIDDNLIVDWRGHGMSRNHSVLPPYIQFNVHGWRYSNGRNFWVDDQTYVEALELPSVVGDFALSDGDNGYDGSNVDPDFRIDYYLHIPLGVDPDEVYRVDR